MGQLHLEGHLVDAWVEHTLLNREDGFLELKEFLGVFHFLLLFYKACFVAMPFSLEVVADERTFLASLDFHLDAAGMD